MNGNLPTEPNTVLSIARAAAAPSPAVAPSPAAGGGTGEAQGPFTGKCSAVQASPTSDSAGLGWAWP